MVNRRKQVQSLIQELGEASRRPLFVEIALIRNRAETKNEAASSTTTTTTTPPKQLSSRATTPTTQIQSPPTEEAKKLDRPWHELLSEASTLLPFFTEDEHGELLRITSILFLGFLLPHSTGNDFYLLQNMPQQQRQAARGSASSSFDVDHYILHLDLEERLEKSCTNLSANQFGEEPMETLTDPDVDLALDLFLQSVAKMLTNRPAHREQVDLLHLFAMVIHPNPVPPPLSKNIVNSFAENNNPAWLRAERLMQNLYAHQFQIHYGHRVRMVKLVRDYLVLPELCDMALVVGPLLYGSLQHLRASLRAFAAGAACHRHAHWAHSALVSMAAQSQNFRILLKEEWDFILHLMVDDFADYGCNQETCRRFKNQTEKERSRSDLFCPHAARGELLSDFILRTCRSRRDADQVFLEHAVVSLTDAIEWQVDYWTRDGDASTEGTNKNDDKKMHAPCLLASLLLAANQLFYFQPRKADSVDDSDDDDPFDTLIQSSIQLLRHPDNGVVAEASRLLVHAFSNTKSNAVNDHASLLLRTFKIYLETNRSGTLLKPLVSVASSESPAFASAMYKFLKEHISKNEPPDDIETSYRLLAAVSLNCPATALKDIDFLILLMDGSPKNLRLHAASAALSSRQAHFFVEKTDKTTSSLKDFLASDAVDNWTRYRLARHSLLTGNFGVAADLLPHLLSCPLSEKHYIWISVLERVAVAESSLSKHGAIGIPSATKSLNSAVSYLQSLGTFSSDWKEGGLFQLKFLLLRMDFLDLVTIVRQLTKEMRLTGSGPGKYTRSFLHLRNVIRGFLTLSSRYDEFIQQQGLFLRDRQSLTCLRILRSLSSFLAHATKAVFTDILHPRSSSSAPVEPFVCDFRHPMASLVRRLDKLVVQPMDGSLDPIVRAAAMLELINGVLMAPLPFPSDFFVPRPTPIAELQISADPMPVFDSDDESFLIVEAVPSLSFSFIVTGRLPKVLLTRPTIPTSTILLWFRLDYCRPLVDEDDNNKDEDAPEALQDGEIKMPDFSGLSPASATLSREGNFFFSVECPPLVNEGLYTLKVRLGCRDVMGSEWKIPVDAQNRNTTVRVSLSRSIL